MATLLFDAIEIITDNGLGVPVAYVNTGIGLMSDGHFALMTDRFTVTTATGDSTRTDWVKGILTGDHGNWTLSRNIDFVEAGAFESVSDFQVGIKNISDFRNTLQANGVYLGRRRVKYYRATSTDGATWNFELRWTGVVDDQPFNELRQSLKCVSTSKDIFGTLPTVPANKTAFPLMPDNSQDKMIPIALGRVARSPLVNVSGSGQKTVTDLVSGLIYPVNTTPGYPTNVFPGSNVMYVAAIRAYFSTGTLPPADGVESPPSLTLITVGKNFIDGELAGKYLHVIAGGVDQSILIAQSFATSAGLTHLYLAENFDVSTPFHAYDNSDTSTGMWYVEIVDYAATLIASSKPVYGLISGASGILSLNRYLSDANIFDSIGDAVTLSSLTNIKSTGYPGLFLVSRTADNGSLNLYCPIAPTQIYVVSFSNVSGLPAVGAAAPLLCNINPNDYYALTSTSGVLDFTLDINFAPDALLKQYSELYALFDLSHVHSVVSAPMSITVHISGTDYLGRATGDIKVYEVKNSSLGTTLTDLFRLPGSYFNLVRDDSAFYKDKGNYNIQSLIGDSKKLSAYNRVRFKFVLFVDTGGGGTYTMNLREMGLVGKRSISFSSETVYSSLRGEVYGNTMDGRVDAADYPNSAVRALEYLIRNYDEKALPWTASHAYVAGDFVRGTADTGHVFVCTVAGTSSGSEPTWTDTTGATYTDGGVTWKEHHEIPIDTASFDSAAGARGFWLVGRTLTEKKDSLEYYQSLLAQSFLLGVTKPDGKVQVKAWLQNTTPLVAFSEANILPGTLGDVVETPVRRLYNLPTIKYDKNPASGEFNKQIAVTNIDKPAFPSSTESSSVGTDLGAFTVTYVDLGGGEYVLTFNTTLPHGMTGGEYVDLTGNADGYNFSLRQVISAADGGAANYFKVSVTGGGFTALPSSSGTVKKYPSSRLKWQDYVTGIQNYSTAKDLWQPCRNSYLVTKKANPLPDSLSQCEWFFDIYAQDANGKYIFSNDGGLTPEYDLGDTHAAAGFALAVATWTAWKKKQPTFEVADTSTFSALGLGDCVSFSDAKLTAGTALIGWIHEKTQLPRTGGSKPQPERFRFGLTLYPEALNVYTPAGIIEEHGATDIIDEHGATNIIEEHGA